MMVGIKKLVACVSAAVIAGGCALFSSDANYAKAVRGSKAAGAASAIAMMAVPTVRTNAQMVSTAVEVADKLATVSATNGVTFAALATPAVASIIDAKVAANALTAAQGAVVKTTFTAVATAAEKKIDKYLTANKVTPDQVDGLVAAYFTQFSSTVKYIEQVVTAKGAGSDDGDLIE